VFETKVNWAFLFAWTGMLLAGIALGRPFIAALSVLEIGLTVENLQRNYDKNPVLLKTTKRSMYASVALLVLWILTIIFVI
jgi:hypothetical protein